MIDVVSNHCRWVKASDARTLATWVVQAFARAGRVWACVSAARGSRVPVSPALALPRLLVAYAAFGIGRLFGDPPCALHGGVIGHSSGYSPKRDRWSVKAG